MSDTLEFEYEGFHVSVTYKPATNTVKRNVSESGVEIYQDELNFDKSLVAGFVAMSAQEQAKIANAWGAAGIKTRIEDGQFESRN